MLSNAWWLSLDVYTIPACLSTFNRQPIRACQPIYSERRRLTGINLLCRHMLRICHSKWLPVGTPKGWICSLLHYACSICPISLCVPLLKPEVVAVYHTYLPLTWTYHECYQSVRERTRLVSERSVQSPNAPVRSPNAPIPLANAPVEFDQWNAAFGHRTPNSWNWNSAYTWPYS